MRRYSAVHLSDPALLSEASRFASGERSNLVQLLVRIAEIDARKLYLPAGYPSLTAFCMEEYRLTEDEAEKRIHAARTARLFPALFEAMDGRRLCMTAVCMLAPHLTAENLDELVGGAAACRRMSDLRAYLQRFAKPDLLLSARWMPTQALDSPKAANLSEVVNSPALERVSAPLGVPETIDIPDNLPAVVASAELSTKGLESPLLESPLAESPVVEPPAPERVSAPLPEEEWVELRVKVRKSKLQHARNLLSHAVPSGNASLVFDRALDALITQGEKKKYAACKKPRAPRPRSTRDRCIPAHVRRAVWERDGGQCTFVSGSGRRCTARRLLEFDHVKPLALGGKATINGIRLRCRGHNQYEAEQAFGASFMRKKREEAKKLRAGKATESTLVDVNPARQTVRDDGFAGLSTLDSRAAARPRRRPPS